MKQLNDEVMSEQAAYVGFRLPEPYKRAFRMVVADRGLTMSEALNRYIEETVRTHRDGMFLRLAEQEQPERVDSTS